MAALKACVVQIARPTEASQAGQGIFTFCTGPLATAGAYTAVADWSEHRMGMPLTNARSPATSIPVAAGPPADARVRPACDLPACMIFLPGVQHGLPSLTMPVRSAWQFVQAVSHRLCYTPYVLSPICCQVSRRRIRPV